jgi:glycosyltransferase involved in cell wall biosynthesis
VIPVFNGSVFVVQAVKSVLKSTFKNYEILLIDDGSTDQSKKICQALEKKYKNVKFYSFGQNRGLGRVLNFALRQARGKYICRINQDDQMHPARISKQIKFLQAHPKVVLIGSWLLVEDENSKIRINKYLEDDEQIKKTWLKLSPCWDASVMYLKQAALAVGGYDQKFWPSDDLHLWYRLGRIGEIANLQEPLTKIKFHSGMTSMKYHRKHMETTYTVHRWAHKNVCRASIGTQLYWFSQLVAGYLFPAKFNWFIYRLLKKYIFYRLGGQQKETVQTADNWLQLGYAS